MGERIFMLYSHIHKAEHFTFKILFIHNVSAQLWLLWTLVLELHFTPLFQTQRIRCTLHFKQKSKRSSSSAILPRDAETTIQFRGQWWVSPHNTIFHFWFIHEESHCPISNHYSTEIRGNEVCLFFKRKINFSTLTRWSTKRIVFVKAALWCLPHNCHNLDTWYKIGKYTQFVFKRKLKICCLSIFIYMYIYIYNMLLIHVNWHVKSCWVCHCPLSPRSPGYLNLTVSTAWIALTPEEFRQCNNKGSTFYLYYFCRLLNHEDYKDFIKVWWL